MSQFLMSFVLLGAGLRPRLRVCNSQTDEAVGFREPRLARETNPRWIAEDVEKVFLLGTAGLEELETLEHLDAACPTCGAAARERHRRELGVAHVDEPAAFGNFDRSIFAEEVAFEEDGGHRSTGLSGRREGDTR
jgi:hypothetical protein